MGLLALNADSICDLSSGGAAASQGPMGGGGGLAAMLGQMMQSPALQQMAQSLEDRPAGRRGGAQQAAPDFGTFLQDMMPMVGQVRRSQSVPCCWQCHTCRAWLMHTVSPAAVAAMHVREPGFMVMHRSTPSAVLL